MSAITDSLSSTMNLQQDCAQTRASSGVTICGDIKTDRVVPAER